MWLQTLCVYALWPSGFGFADAVIIIIIIIIVAGHQEFLASILDLRILRNRPTLGSPRHRGEHLGIPRHGNFRRIS